MPKTWIGVLASHDSPEKNEALCNIFEDIYSNNQSRKLLEKFRFVFTGGTYNRLINGAACHGARGTTIKHRLSDEVAKFLHEKCGVIRLPSVDNGGVIMLNSLITLHKISIIWPFFSPVTTHLLYPANLSLLRLADLWRVKKLMNTGSVKEWFRAEAERDSNLNNQKLPLTIQFPGEETVIELQAADYNKKKKHHKLLDLINLIKPEKEKSKDCEYPIKDADETNIDKKLGETVLALISHDAMKSRILDFVIDYEHELKKFKCILTTGTTGKNVEERVPSLSGLIKKHHSGPHGGDVEIATEILLGCCHVVIFFVDPLHPHPHSEDIRLVFAACMIQDDVRMLSNEMQARDWMDIVVRGR